MEICSCFNSSTATKAGTLVGVALLVIATVVAVAAAILFFSAPTLFLSLGVSAFQMSILSGCLGVIGSVFVAVSYFSGKVEVQQSHSNVSYENKFKFHGPASETAKNIIKRHLLEAIRNQHLCKERVNCFWPNIVCYEMPQNIEKLQADPNLFQNNSHLYLMIYNNEQDWKNGEVLHRVEAGCVVLKLLLENGKLNSNYVRAISSQEQRYYISQNNSQIVLDMFNVAG